MQIEAKFDREAEARQWLWGSGYIKRFTTLAGEVFRQEETFEYRLLKKWGREWEVQIPTAKIVEFETPDQISTYENEK